MDSWNILLGGLEMSLEMSISKVFTYSRSSWLNKFDGIVGYYISSHRSNSIFSNRGEDFLPVLLKFRFSFLLPILRTNSPRFSWRREIIPHNKRERDSSVSLSFRFNLRKETQTRATMFNNGGRSSRRRCVRVTVADETNNCWKIPGLHRPRPPCY